MSAQKQPSLFGNLLLNILIPTLILTKLSTDQWLGPTWAVVAALAFPLAYGLYDLKQSGKVNFISILGVVSVLLTGGISLLELDPKYLAIKEAAIPTLIGLALLISQFTSYPLLHKLLYNDQILNLAAIKQALSTEQQQAELAKRLTITSYLVASSFFLSGVLNYLLARWIVVSPPGTSEFAAELGKMTALSYPVIMVPSMIVLMASLWYLLHSLKKLTGLDTDQLLAVKG
ncbi:MFS transporter [Deefgea piscis]|uniref:MFS transporter n=1 Tax=Deefgea piscis TaxID=2739061 RepID=A0A6M8SPV6_9NEIS|nr:VC0807 family protein [Deefgea piscis]QKJ67293.1 MFS transporter [Deefgea piscis]